MTELNYSTRFSKQQTRFSHMTSNQVFENCQLEKSHWKINYIVTTEYIILASNPHSIFIFKYFKAELLGKYSQTPIRQLCDSCQIIEQINIQNNMTWPNSNTAGISLDSRLKYSKITHRYWKELSIHLVLVMITSHWYRFHPIYLSNSPVLWHKCQRMFTWASCTSARHAGSFDCLMTSLILITMDNGRGHCALWQSCKVPNQTHRGIKKNG